jgi:hydrogenase maturation protease
MDLALAMQEGYEAVVLLDATPRGGVPGTLYVIEPEVPDHASGLDAHGMDPVKVLALARATAEHASAFPRTLVVGCEPAVRMDPETDEIVAVLSEPVRAALDEAIRLVESLLTDLTEEDPCPSSSA